MSEAYSESFQPEPPDLAGEPGGESAGAAASAAPRDTGGGPASAGNPDTDQGDASGDNSAGSDVGASLAAEERHPPEHRDRQGATAATWDDATTSADDDQGSFSSDPASEYDGDVAALFAEEQRLPDPATRQEAAAATRDDSAEPGDADPWAYSGNSAAEYDGDVAALFAEEQRLPEPGTRQEAAVSTGDDTTTSPDTEIGASTDGTSPGQPGNATEPYERDDDRPDGAETGRPAHDAGESGTDTANLPMLAQDATPQRVRPPTGDTPGNDNRSDGSQVQEVADDPQRDEQQQPDNFSEKTRPGHPDIHDRHPSDYKLAPDAPPPKIDGPHEPPERWAEAINPDKQAPARRINCGDCSRSVDSTWHGYPAVAAAVDYPRYLGDAPARMAEWAGVKPVPASMADIKDRLDKLGPGSSAIVGCNWKTGRGHWFNAVNDGGALKAVDGQSGKVEAWPPTRAGLRFDEGQMRYSDAIFFTPDGKVVPHDQP